MWRVRGVALLVASAAVLASSACSPAPVVGDGSLGISWATLPTPSVPAPAVGVCTPAGAEAAPSVGWDMPIFASSPVPRVDCGNEHISETVFVGTFPADEGGTAAARPKLGSALFRSAYQTCTQRANEFLGGDFHTARVAVRPVMPTERQWAGNARWYRCETMEISDASGRIRARTASLRDGLRGTKPLAISCGDETLSEDQKFVQNITFVECTSPHDVELTGIHVAADEEYPGDAKAQAAALDACYGVGATYLGMTRTALDATGGIRWLFWGGSSDFWSAGDRSYRCYLGEFPRRRLTGSIAGHKPGTFPH